MASRDLGTDGPADLVLAGAVHTEGPARPTAECVAIGEGRILAVGSRGEIAPLIGRHTEVIDARDGSILAGFQDAHVHPAWGGLAAMRCDLYEAEPSSYGRIVSEYVRLHPDVAWVEGGGWSMAAFEGGTPRREDLDARVPDRPAYLTNRDGHGAWVNSRALALAGITRDTPDPPDGRIERDREGEPSGTLHEGAMDLVERLIPPPTAQEWEEALLRAQAHLHSLGITGWQDAIVIPEILAAYRALAERGELTARVVGALWWDRHRGEDQVEELVDKRASGSVGRFRATSVKVMQDGVCENFTAAMLDPYLDSSGRPTPNRGLSMVDPEELDRAVTRLDRAGFQVHVHAIGDRAVREALDAFEAARSANGVGDHRHHIAHIQIIHPDDVPRFATLGVVANGQPYWACLEEYQRDLTIPFLGPDRAGRQYPFASLLRTGATLAFGSDWNVSTPNPFLELEVAVTRVAPDDRDAEPFLPHERLDLSTAVRAFTMGSAFVNHLDEVTGSIEPGKLADLVVLDRDIFAEDAGPIGDARVALTLMEGRPVHTDGSLV
jgi:predicted amidohydrolase YtcJ